MNTLAIDPLLIFWFISFLLSFPIPSNPQSLLFPVLSSFLNPEFAFLAIKSQAIKDNNGKYTSIGHGKLVNILGIGVKENDAKVFNTYLEKAVVEQVASEQKAKN